MSHKAALAPGGSFVAKLAQFFPNATPVRVPVSISRSSAAGKEAQENTVIEFGTSREVLFASRLALDFEEKVRIQGPSLDAEATVVAVQLAGEQSAVALRFTEEVANWIIQPVNSTRSR